MELGGTLDTNTDNTAAYAAATAIISKFETLTKNETRKDKTTMQTEITASSTFFDYSFDKIAKGVMMKTAVNAAVVTHPIISAMGIVFW